MKNEEYWKRRAELLEESSFEQGEDFLREVQILYDKADRKIQKELLGFYTQLAENNEISLLEAKKLLTTDELKEFQWDLEEYIRACKAVDGNWSKEILNASLRERISRLEATQKKIQWLTNELAQTVSTDLSTALKTSYQESFTHTLYENQSQMGNYHRVETLNQKRLLDILKKPWTVDGKTFSDRIWANQKKLYSVLNTDLTQSLMRGEGVSQASKALSKRMGVSYKNAKRLIRTEFGAYHSNAKKDAYIRDGVKRYKIHATIDARTSEICHGLNGKVFEVSAYEVGLTAPPFHPNCRTTTFAMLPEKYEKIFKELGYDDWLKYVK